MTHVTTHTHTYAHIYTCAVEHFYNETSVKEKRLSGQDAGQTPQEALIRARHLYGSSQHKGEPLTARNL